jgi:hypothetical protein
VQPSPSSPLTATREAPTRKALLLAIAAILLPLPAFPSTVPAVADATWAQKRNGGLAAVALGVALASVGGSAFLSMSGRNRLEIVAPKHAEGPELIGLGLAPTSDRGMAASAAFSF